MTKKVLLIIGGIVTGLLTLGILKVIGSSFGYPNILGIPYYPALLMLTVIIFIPLTIYLLKKSK